MEVKHGGPSQIFADVNILFRILLNLARNAGVTGATGLQIDIWRASHLGFIDTLDNGSGIGDNERRMFFQAFKKRQRLAARVLALPSPKTLPWRMAAI